MIFGHYLTVQPWTSSFRSQDHVVNQVIGWIRLPKLLARYYHKSIIRSIGGVFGEVFKVDYNTDSGDHGKFARIAVVIDLTKPLISKIQVDGELIFVEYGGLPSICFNCGLYGHLQDSCSAKMVADARVSTVSSPSSEPNVPARDVQESPHFGAWMQVQRRRRNVDRGNKSNIASDSKSVVNGSRFEVLGDALDEERQNILDPRKGNHYLNDETIIRKSKAKETKGVKKASTEKAPNDNLASKNHDSAPHRKAPIKGSKVGPISHQPIRDKDPFSKARGIKLSSGISIQKMGSKPTSEGLGASVRVLKELARGIQSEFESPVEVLQEVGVDPPPNLPL
ncbi:hypothetical protein K1719_015586 [Acacia pycnantha]|nr:hypothetical protein K1719_015586 [Acacia pycnantha]